jgi:hypothetical protein
VSVRDADEAAVALACGVDLLDVKDPQRGSLGRAAPDAIAGVARVRKTASPETPLSVALGELNEWSGVDAGVALPAAGVTFVKLGLAGMGADRDWRSKYLEAQQQLSLAVDASPAWVAVAYVDADRAEAPAVESVMDAALEQGCAGILFDTWCKRSPGLFGCWSQARLESLVERVRANALFCAVAGRLQLGELERLRHVPVDVIAVRSAACRESDRQATLCRDRLLALRERVARIWPSG